MSLPVPPVARGPETGPNGNASEAAARPLCALRAVDDRGFRQARLVFRRPARSQSADFEVTDADLAVAAAYEEAAAEARRIPEAKETEKAGDSDSELTDAELAFCMQVEESHKRTGANKPSSSRTGSSAAAVEAAIQAAARPTPATWPPTRRAAPLADGPSPALLEKRAAAAARRASLTPVLWEIPVTKCFLLGCNPDLVQPRSISEPLS